jgi:flagellar motor switch protein FliM
MAFVRAMQENFAGAFALGLAARLETPVSAQLAPAQPLSRSAFVESGEDGGCLLTLDAEPVRGQVLIAFSAGLAAYLLRVLLCAPPDSAEGPRVVTEIELHILREIFESLARELTAAWKNAGIAFRWTSTGAREGADGHDAMLVFECRMDFGDVRETFRVAVPAFLARMAALQCTPAAEEAPAAVREMIFNALRRANVSVEAVLSSSMLRMEDLLAMEPGHVLMLAQPAGSPVECHVGGQPKFRGEWVRHGNRQALVLL